MPFSNGCVDLAPVPVTADIVVIDEEGGVQRLSPDGTLQRILAE